MKPQIDELMDKIYRLELALDLAIVQRDAAREVLAREWGMPPSALRSLDPWLQPER